MIETSGAQDEVLKVLPALTIEDELLKRGLEIIESSVAAAVSERGQGNGAKVLKLGGKKS